MNEKEKLESFLKSYKRLVKKHNAYISACGCCNSPWIIFCEEEIDKEYMESIISHLRDEA